MAGHYNEMYQLVKTGRVFHGTTAAAGVLLPASTASSSGTTFGLWNPAGNTYNASILSLRVGWASSGANLAAPGTILYNALTGAGSIVASGGPISAYTTKTATNALAGSGTVSTMLFAGSSTITSTVLGTIVGGTGMSVLTSSSTVTTAPQFELVDDLNSMWVVPPGTFFYLTSSVAQTALLSFEMIWAELQ